MIRNPCHNRNAASLSEARVNPSGLRFERQRAPQTEYAEQFPLWVRSGLSASRQSSKPKPMPMQSLNEVSQKIWLTVSGKKGFKVQRLTANDALGRPIRAGSRMADDKPPPKEHRTLGRKRSLLSAVAVSADGAMTFDCAIRDLSARGGKIRSSSVHLPDRFYLINIRDQVAYDATIAWKRNGEAGLKWNNVIPLAGTPDGRFAHLRRIWTERAPR
jgi:hypothetical protein